MSNLLAVVSGHNIPELNVTNRFGEDGAGPDQMTHHGEEAIDYDLAGRAVEDGERTLQWDAKGRLARVERGEVVEEYVYGFDDVRVIKRTVQNGQESSTRYLAADAELRDGTLIRYVLVDAQRVARLDRLPTQSTDTSEPDDGSAPASVADRGRRGPGPGGTPHVGLSWLWWPLAALLALLGSWGLMARPRPLRRLGKAALEQAWARLLPSVCCNPARLGAAAAGLVVVALVVASALAAPGCARSSGLDRSDPNAGAAGGSPTDPQAGIGLRKPADPRADARAIDTAPAGAVFYHSDWQNSPLVLTDAGGEVIRTVAYHPYGSLRHEQGDSRDPHGFGGNECDGGSGLSDFRARPYRAQAAAFLAPDPVAVLEAEQTLGQPSRLAAYAYGGGDPINHSDPGGEFWDLALDAAFIGYDVGRLIADNVIGRTTEGLATNMAALGLDVACAIIPAATGGGVAYRAAQAGGKTAAQPVAHMFASGGKRTVQAQAKAQQARGGTFAALPPPSVVPNAAGRIVSFTTKQDQVFYRVYSRDVTRGSFLTGVAPKNGAFAREALALPPGNKAEFIQKVTVPSGTRVQRARALPNFGRRGGAEQFELLEQIPNSSFGSGVPLP